MSLPFGVGSGVPATPVAGTQMQPGMAPATMQPFGPHNAALMAQMQLQIQQMQAMQNAYASGYGNMGLQYPYATMNPAAVTPVTAPAVKPKRPYTKRKPKTPADGEGKAISPAASTASGGAAADVPIKTEADESRKDPAIDIKGENDVADDTEWAGEDLDILCNMSVAVRDLQKNWTDGIEDVIPKEMWLDLKSISFWNAAVKACQYGLKLAGRAERSKKAITSKLQRMREALKKWYTDAKVKSGLSAEDAENHEFDDRALQTADAIFGKDIISEVYNCLDRDDDVGEVNVISSDESDDGSDDSMPKIVLEQRGKGIVAGQTGAKVQRKTGNVGKDSSDSSSASDDESSGESDSGSRKKPPRKRRKKDNNLKGIMKVLQGLTANMAKYMEVTMKTSKQHTSILSSSASTTAKTTVPPADSSKGESDTDSSSSSGTSDISDVVSSASDEKFAGKRRRKQATTKNTTRGTAPARRGRGRPRKI